MRLIFLSMGVIIIIGLLDLTLINTIKKHLRSRIDEDVLGVDKSWQTVKKNHNGK